MVTATGTCGQSSFWPWEWANLFVCYEGLEMKAPAYVTGTHLRLRCHPFITELLPREAHTAHKGNLCEQAHSLLFCLNLAILVQNHWQTL